MNTILNTTAKLHHATRAKAEKLHAILTAEYPVLSLNVIVDGPADKVIGFSVIYDAEGELGDEVVVYEGPKVPELADIIDECTALELDPEALEGEEKPGGSVVPEAYRVAYRASATTGQTCGDWLATWLEGECLGLEGFDRVAFFDILRTNLVDQSGAWAKLPESGQRGWVGRWRMNGRQQIEKRIALSGALYDGAAREVKIPAEVVALMKTKHNAFLLKVEKAIAKEAKAAAAAKQSA